MQVPTRQMRPGRGRLVPALSCRWTAGLSIGSSHGYGKILSITVGRLDASPHTARFRDPPEKTCPGA
jgi:hypothetical protein